MGARKKVGVTDLRTGPLGIEPSDDDSQRLTEQALTQPPYPDGTKYGTKTFPEPLADADLGAIVSAWPELPEAIRAGMVAMVRAASGSGSRA